MMATWRDNPEIVDLGAYCKRHGHQAAVVVAFSGGRFSVTSYGRDGRLCRAAGKVADQIGDLIEAGEIECGELGEG